MARMISAISFQGVFRLFGQFLHFIGNDGETLCRVRQPSLPRWQHSGRVNSTARQSLLMVLTISLLVSLDRASSDLTAVLIWLDIWDCNIELLFQALNGESIPFSEALNMSSEASGHFSRLRLQDVDFVGQ